MIVKIEGAEPGYKGPTLFVEDQTLSHVSLPAKNYLKIFRLKDTVLIYIASAGVSSCMLWIWTYKLEAKVSP